MSIACATCGLQFSPSSEEEAFLQKMTFTFGQENFTLPLPTSCPPCRLQTRVAHRNEQNLYKNVSALSGKSLISIYAPNALHGENYKVYTQEEWNADAFDPLIYGRAFDDTKSFFEQFAALQKAVPRAAVITMSNENSEYSTGTGFCKNCYLINSSENCEDCYYGKLYQTCKNSADCSYLYDSQLCYECFSVYNSYNCAYLSCSQNCSDCFFSENLRSCNHCLLCTNLHHKEYHYMNEPVTKEAFEKHLAEIMGSDQKTQATFLQLQNLTQKRIHAFANSVNSENCTGDYIENSQNCIQCFDINESQDCLYVTVGVQAKDCVDCSNVYLKPELVYNTLGTIEGYLIAYCLFVFTSIRLLYCDFCYHCSDCFGCVGLKKKKFCIFNTQYTKEQYEELVPKIIHSMMQTGEWGRFLPAKYSPFGYNETLANDYYPLAKEEALAKGFVWREKDSKEYIPATCTLADHIKDTPDDVTNEICACKKCGKNYKIIPQELALHRQIQTPLPRLCADCRHRSRLQKRNPLMLWERTCMHCQKPIHTTYAPDRPEIVFCESCYLESVY